ncbi:hypothetical protein J2X78_000481 [Pedobacter africanus]|uniref:Uncharacterized protein n=1 Tax=Pedobacter africanus TaxID=151894 RepID=A0ACC6KRI0_9SPHI|nr:hypothetical protein [Pedobacter africanus]
MAYTLIGTQKAMYRVQLPGNFVGKRAADK